MKGKAAKVKIRVDGMSCSSCERRIERAVRSLDGVVEVWASAPLSEVIVKYDPAVIGVEAFREAIRGAGYTVDEAARAGRSPAGAAPGAGAAAEAGDGARAAGTHSGGSKPMSVYQFLGILVVIAAVFLIIKFTVGFSFLPTVTQSMGFGLIFVVGLITSLHCIAMCGGITLSQTVARTEEDDAARANRTGPRESKGEPGAQLASSAGLASVAERSPAMEPAPAPAKELAPSSCAVTPPAGRRFSRLLPSLLYNGGRVISYTIVGGVIGALGSLFNLSATFKGIMPAIAGVFMLFIGVKMLGVFPWLSRIRIRMPWGGGRLRKTSGSPLIVGLLNGLMPCGPLQTMQVYALGTGSFYAGALSMFLFSLGTVPLMFGFGAISSFLSARFNRHMLKASGVLVMVLGLVMFTRGLNLFGVALPTIAAPSQVAVARMADGTQTVTTTFKSGSYYPFVVQKGVPVRWIINVTADDLNGCNNPVTVPTYGIRKQLVPGENVIEFTPDREGTISYTCWMGMISSTIRVVPDLARLTVADLTPPADPSQTDQVQNQAQNQGGIAGAFPGGSGQGGCCGASTPAAFAGGKVPTDAIGLARLEGPGQTVDVMVSDQGYTPAVLVLQKGVKAKIRFIAQKLNTCNSPVMFPEYNGGLDLLKGQLETPYLDVSQDFTFQCGMGMLHGYVKVVDDLAKVDLNAIKREVGAYRPQGGGGCCGGGGASQ